MHGVGDMTEDKYTIEPWTFALMYGQAFFKAGDLIDLITGDTIVGLYCVWPKQEPRYFVVNAEVDPIDMEVKTINLNSPEFIEKCNKSFDAIFKKHDEEEIKFYQKLNGDGKSIAQKLAQKVRDKFK